jgi:hypothetical protein
MYQKFQFTCSGNLYLAHRGWQNWDHNHMVSCWKGPSLLLEHCPQVCYSWSSHTSVVSECKRMMRELCKHLTIGSYAFDMLIFNALIRCIKYIKDQQTHFNFNDVLLLYYGHQHVLAIHVAIFRVISWRTRIQLWLKCVWITPQF